MDTVKLKTGEIVPVEEVGVDVSGEAVRCHPHWKKPNLCNDLSFSWGSKECRQENQNLPMVGGVINCEGYAIPRDAILHSLTATWDPSCPQYNEELTLQVNGQDIPGAVIELTNDLETTKVCITGLKVKLNECDSINIISRRVAKELDWIQVCNLEVTAFLELECHKKLPREGDGIIEVLDTEGTSPITDTWAVRELNDIRQGIIPFWATFSDTGDYLKLKAGHYKLWYGVGIKTEKSTNLIFEAKLQIDTGSGWGDIPFSGNVDHDLSGDKGALNVTRMITYQIPVGAEYKFRIVERISSDTSIQAAQSGASLIAERVVNGAW